MWGSSSIGLPGHCRELCGIALLQSSPLSPITSLTYECICCSPQRADTWNCNFISEAAGPTIKYRFRTKVLCTDDLGLCSLSCCAFFFLIFKKLMGRKREANKQLLMVVSDILKSGWRGGHVSVKEKKIALKTVQILVIALCFRLNVGHISWAQVCRFWRKSSRSFEIIFALSLFPSVPSVIICMLSFCTSGILQD